MKHNFYKVIKFICLYARLTIFDIRLHRVGFNELFYKYSQSYPVELESPISGYDSRKIDEDFRMLDIVCTWYPRKADCIHKTFLGYMILRRKYNIKVNMVVGVRKFPFEAHAWLKKDSYDFFQEDTDKYKVILNSLDYIRS